MAPPSCRRLTPGGMGLARGAQQEETEPDCRCLRARSLGVGTRTCYRTVVRTDQPKRAERLGPKGQGPWATGSSSRGLHSDVDTADSTALRLQTNAQQERSNVASALHSGGAGCQPHALVDEGSPKKR